MSATTSKSAQVSEAAKAPTTVSFNKVTYTIPPARAGRCQEPTTTGTKFVADLTLQPSIDAAARDVYHAAFPVQKNLRARRTSLSAFWQTCRGRRSVQAS